MTIIKQLKYELQTYFKGSTFIMPFVAIIVFLYAFYTFKPVDVMSGYLMTCGYSFLIMVWIGMTEAQRENPVMEQILLLKIGDARKYYFGKYIFLMILTLLVSLICSVFPFWQNYYVGGDLFKRQLLFADLVNAFILMVGCGICGVTIGDLLHPRVLGNRKLAIMLTVLLTVLALCSFGIIQEVPAMKSILWIIPPVMLPQQIYGKEEFFHTTTSLQILGILFGYSIVFCFVKSLICYKKKF